MTTSLDRYDTNDALYDLAWSEINENQVLAACGDGSIKLFDLGVDNYPVMNYHEHKRETFSVFWNQTTKDTFVSSSWDGTVKIVWHKTPDSGHSCIPRQHDQPTLHLPSLSKIQRTRYFASTC